MTAFRVVCANAEVWQRVLRHVVADWPDLEGTDLSAAEDPEQSERILSFAHGYQINARASAVLPGFHVTARFLKRAHSLLAVVSSGSGVDAVDIEACTKRGVAVCAQTGANREAVAEHAVGMMLGLARRIPLADRLLRAGTSWDGLRVAGQEIYGKVLGIIGLGATGGRVAEIARAAFAMPVLAYDPYVSEERASALGARLVSLSRLLAQAEVVSVHCPLTDETRGLLNRERLAQMRESALLIVMARGGIVDEPALAERLRAGCLAGAGVDVFEPEPPAPDNPLLGLDTVIVTPHIGGASGRARARVIAGASEQWRALARGVRPPRLLNPEAWPKVAERYLEQFRILDTRCG